MTDAPIDLSSRRPAPAPEPEELILVCECGCRTFYVAMSGSLECSSCGEILEDDLTGYDPAEVKKVSPPKEPHDRHSMGSVDIAFHHTLNAAKVGDTVALVVMNKNGITHTWSEGAEGADQEAWLRERIDGLWESLK